MFGIKYAILRYFNAAGADPSSEIGEAHDPETHLIPLVLKSFLKKKIFNIYGTNFKTPDGTAIRDFIHVNDLAFAHILSLKKIFKLKKSIKLNLGTEKGHSVKQIVRETEKLLKKKIKIKNKKKRQGDVSKLVSSSKKAKKTINWTAKNSSIKNIILTAYNWHKKQI